MVSSSPVPSCLDKKARRLEPFTNPALSPVHPPPTLSPTFQTPDKANPYAPATPRAHTWTISGQARRVNHPFVNFLYKLLFPSQAQCLLLYTDWEEGKEWE